MLKGVLSLLLLHLIEEQEDYGYALVLRLHRATFVDLGEGTVYPALTRLEGNGLLSSRLVRSASGPARKYYAVTESGLRELARGREAWHDLVRAVATVLPPEGHPGQSAGRAPSEREDVR